VNTFSAKRQLTSSFVTNGGLISGDVDGHDALVAVLGAELQDVVGPLVQAVDATKDDSGLKNKPGIGLKKSFQKLSRSASWLLFSILPTYTSEQGDQIGRILGDCLLWAIIS
jgi:hypothetical protein